MPQVEKLSPIRLETPRLILREFQPEDYPNLYRLYTDHTVTRFTSEPPFESVEHVARAFANYADKQYKLHGTGRLTVVEKESGNYVGWCGLKTLEDGEVDLDFRFLPQFWGKGYGYEAADACLKYGFDVLGLESILSDAQLENTGSIRLKEKLGMELVGNYVSEGKPCVLYRITREQFQAREHSKS